MSRLWWVLIAAAGCATSDAGPAPDVAVELAAVTLGDDCGGGVMPPPVKVADDEQAKKRSGDDAKRDRDALYADACQQTSMQLVLKATAKAKATKIKIKRVEILDPKGKVLETLASKQPMKWNGKRYENWNEAVAAAETLQTTYVVATPNWVKLSGSRRAATTKTFQIRVTVTVGTQDRTFEKQATVSAQLEPDVDT